MRVCVRVCVCVCCVYRRQQMKRMQAYAQHWRRKLMPLRRRGESTERRHREPHTLLRVSVRYFSTCSLDILVPVSAGGKENPQSAGTEGRTLCCGYV
jgi:hypothetical protein